MDLGNNMHNNDLEGPRIEVGPNGISNKPSFESSNNGGFGKVLILLVIVMIFSGALFYGMMAFFKYAQEDLWNDANYASDTSEISTGTVNSEDYIYIGEWGIKIKKPAPATGDKQLVGISYAFDNYRLYLWGTVYRDGDQAVGKGAMYSDQNNKIEAPALVKITLSSTEKCSDWDGVQFSELNGLALCYSETNDEFLRQTYGDLEYYIQPTLELLKEHFTDLDNYSKI